MVGEGDRLVSTGRALVGAHAPILLESPGAADRGLVDALGAVDRVGPAVALDRAEHRSAFARRRELAAPVVDHVILDERLGAPAIEREVAVGAGLETGGTVVDPARGRAGAPAGAGN